jgi:NAD-dependent dihydropyrimidine dehydrogenase PreA subunit
MGIFIQITADQQRLTSDTSQQLVRVCPVDIFALEGERLVVRPDEEDECTLCELCLRAAPPGAITIRKTYNGQTLVSDGAAE